MNRSPQPASGWLLGRSLKNLWSASRIQVRTVPARAWLAWTAILAVGFVLCTLLVLGITRLGQYLVDRGLQTWDQHTLEAVLRQAPMEFADAIMYESPGNLLYIGPLIAVALVIAIRRGQVLVGVSLLVGYLLQRPLVIFGWMWWDRARPEFIASGVGAPAFHSFPSGHAAMSTFAYGFLAYLWARATPHWSERVFAFALALAWVAMINVGRLRLGAHWPSDVVAGFMIAVAWLAVVVVAHRRLQPADAGGARTGRSLGRGQHGAAYQAVQRHEIVRQQRQL